jgi:hypothetical protein
MKNLIIFVALLASCGFAEAQDLDIRSKGASIPYLRQIQNPIAPEAVREYQIMAVQYNVARSDLFDGRDALFLVVFRTQKGAIEASYDWTGELVQSIERFRNIALPHKILRSGMRPYSGWRVVGTNYYVYYLKNRKTRIIYSIRIADGNRKKKILLDHNGTVIN